MIYKVLLKLFLFSLLILFTACGSSDDSSSESSAKTPSVNTKVISGQIVDGNIKDSKVCLDINADKQCNESEPTTTTASDGTFTLSIDANLSGTYKIISIGGIDTATSQFFDGVLEDVVEIEDGTTDISSTVTPLTTIASKIYDVEKETDSTYTVAKAKAKLATNLNLTIDQVSANPLEDKELFAKTQKIIQAVKILSVSIKNDTTDRSANQATFDTVLTQVSNSINEDTSGNLDIANIVTRLEAEDSTVSISNDVQLFVQSYANKVESKINALSDTSELGTSQRGLETFLAEVTTIIKTSTTISQDLTTTLTDLDEKTIDDIVRVAKSNKSMLTRSVVVARGPVIGNTYVTSQCETLGGIAIYSGIDANNDGLLSVAEQNDIPQVVCNGANGLDGVSAYKVWLDLGNTGTQADFINSLMGATGANGQNGTDGQDGATGSNGTDGQDGATGSNGLDGASAYQVWLDLGNTGTQADFINSLMGATGSNGTDGQDGSTGSNGLDGASAYQVWLDLGNTGTQADFINSLKVSAVGTLNGLVLLKDSPSSTSGISIIISIAGTTYSSSTNGLGLWFLTLPSDMYIEQSVSFALDGYDSLESSYTFDINTNAITVTNDIVLQLDLAPLFTSADTVAVDENQNVAITVVATDTKVITYGIKNIALTNFDIDSFTGEITLKNENFDFETTPSYLLTLTATDAGGKTSEQNISININDMFESIPQSVSFSTQEEVQVKDTLSFTGQGKDVNNTGFVLDTQAQNGFVSIDTNGSFIYTPQTDFNGTDTFSYKLQAENNNSIYSVSANIMINISNINDAPVITGFTNSTDDNNHTFAGTVVVVDADGDDFNLTLAGVDSEHFTLEQDGKLSFNFVPDIENPQDLGKNNIYDFSIIATDIHDLNDTVTTQLQVTAGGLETHTYEAPASDGTVAIAPPSNYTASNISAPPVSEGTVEIVNNEIVFTPNPTYSGPVSFTITFTLANGTTVTKTYNTVVEDTEPPVFISSNSANVFENTLTAIALSATDSSTPSYYISGGTDASSVSVDSASGIVTFNSSPDYESGKTSYTFTAIATDGTTEVEQSITITILNVDEVAPLFTNDLTLSVLENQTSAVALRATDSVESSASLTYSISGGDAASFDINTVTGDVTFKVAPDYESGKTSYSFDARVSDGTNITTELVTINITDIVVENIAPVANAGADENVAELTTITLDGSSSSDSDGTITSYTWKEADTVFSTNVSFSKSDFTIGTHIITLTVTDNEDVNDTDIVLITINDTNVNEINVSTTAELRSALSTAPDDSVINLAAGIYKTTDDSSGYFDVRNLTLIGSTSGESILDGDSTDRVVQAYNATFKNIHIRNGGGGDSGTTGISASSSKFVNCKIYDNHATQAGYGSAIYGSNNVVLNSLFSNNTGSHYGQIYGGNIAIVNSIFINGDRKAIYPSSSSTYEFVQNNIFIGNISIYDRFDRIDTISNTSYSNTEAESLFINFANSDYRLKENSALIDAGTIDINTTSISPTDILGKSRIIGDQIDIGPYEYEKLVWKGVSYGTITSAETGRIWLDRNLGASQVCSAFDDTACYGDYYQWGRAVDGHEKTTSTTTSTQATTLTAVDGSFITATSSPYDWTSTDSDGTLRSAEWSKTDGTSICPVGYRVPTQAEFTLEVANSAITNQVDAFEKLKLPSSGLRSYGDGSMNDQGSVGYYWSSSVNSTSSEHLLFDSSSAYTHGYNRASGFPVRCVKD